MIHLIKSTVISQELEPMTQIFSIARRRNHSISSEQVLELIILKENRGNFSNRQVLIIQHSVKLGLPPQNGVLDLTQEKVSQQEIQLLFQDLELSKFLANSKRTQSILWLLD